MKFNDGDKVIQKSTGKAMVVGDINNSLQKVDPKIKWYPGGTWVTDGEGFLHQIDPADLMPAFKVGDRVMHKDGASGEIVGIDRLNTHINIDGGSQRYAVPNHIPGQYRLETWKDWPEGCWVVCVDDTDQHSNSDFTYVCLGRKYQLACSARGAGSSGMLNLVSPVGAFNTSRFRRCAPPEKKQWLEYVGDEVYMTHGRAYLKKSSLVGTITVDDDRGKDRAFLMSDFRECNEPEPPKQWAKFTGDKPNIINGKIYEAEDGGYWRWRITDEDGVKFEVPDKYFTPCDAPRVPALDKWGRYFPRVGCFDNMTIGNAYKAIQPGEIQGYLRFKNDAGQFVGLHFSDFQACDPPAEPEPEADPDVSFQALKKVQEKLKEDKYREPEVEYIAGMWTGTISGTVKKIKADDRKNCADWAISKIHETASYHDGTIADVTYRIRKAFDIEEGK